MVNLVIALVPLALIMLALGHPFHSALVFLPVAVLLTMLFALGMSLALAPICLMFVDVAQIYQVLLTAWMYLTPIIYPIDALPPEYKRIIVMNPMTHLVEAFRTPIYLGTFPSSHVLLTATASALGMLVIGWALFDHYGDRIAYYL
jgi:ABC-2 type transport system permease protein